MNRDRKLLEKLFNLVSKQDGETINEIREYLNEPEFEHGELILAGNSEKELVPRHFDKIIYLEGKRYYRHTSGAISTIAKPHPTHIQWLDPEVSPPPYDALLLIQTKDGKYVTGRATFTHGYSFLTNTWLRYAVIPE